MPTDLQTAAEPAFDEVKRYVSQLPGTASGTDNRSPPSSLVTARLPSVRVGILRQSQFRWARARVSLTTLSIIVSNRGHCIGRTIAHLRNRCLSLGASRTRLSRSVRHVVRPQRPEGPGVQAQNFWLASRSARIPSEMGDRVGSRTLGVARVRAFVVGFVLVRMQVGERSLAGRNLTPSAQGGIHVTSLN